MMGGYNKKNQVTITIELEYDYESDLEAVKELIKQIIDLKNITKIDYKTDK